MLHAWLCWQTGDLLDSFGQIEGNEEHLFFLETTYSNNMHTFTNQTGPAFTTHCCHSRTLAILEILLRVEDSVVQLIQNIGTVRCAV